MSTSFRAWLSWGPADAKKDIKSFCIPSVEDEKISGISQGNGAEFEDAEGKTELGEAAQRNSEFLGQNSLAEAPAGQGRGTAATRGTTQSRNKRIRVTQAGKMRTNERDSSKTCICYLILPKHPD